jgi:hypothetical protein
MFKKILDYFSSLQQNVLRISALCSFTNKNVGRMEEEMAQLKVDQIACHQSLLREINSLAKMVSSIEMELLMQRGACLDNNFPGKEEL